MPRLVILLVLAGGCSVLCSAVTGVLVDSVSGVLPEAAPLLEEARRYAWLVGAVLGVLLASVVV